MAEYSNIEWNKASKNMRMPAWVFDSRSVIDPNKVLKENLKFGE